MNATPSQSLLPPFCTPGADSLPEGPVPGSDESLALAAWEVLTGARVARSAGSGRMSLLGRHERSREPLTGERAIWIALHAFEGADERWECRRARAPGMGDAELAAAIVQEMGGPAAADEMATLGFWRADTGFYFDSRGPSIEISELRRGGRGAKPVIRRRRIGRTALLRATRRLLRLGFTGPLASTPARVSPSPSTSASAAVSRAGDAQLSLL